MSMNTNPINSKFDSPILELKDVSKSFFLHQRSSSPFKVLENITFSVSAGECVALEGASGMGKSSILKMIHGNYKVSAGHIFIQHTENNYIDVAKGHARDILDLRTSCINYVSQFLRAIPRVGAFDLIKQEAIYFLQKVKRPQSHAVELPTLILSKQEIQDLDAKVEAILQKLQISPRLWHLPPSTFSGGEQQRINLAKSLINPKPLLLLDEPSASLDHDNTEIVIDLIHEARQCGTAILGIFHDADVKNKLMTRSISMHDFQPKP